MKRTTLSSTLSVALALTALGCGRQAQETILGPPSGSVSVESQLSDARSSHWEGYYPLTIGNRWTYEYESSKSFAPVHGDTISKHGHTRNEIQAAGFTVVAGNTYVRREITAYEATQTLHFVDFVRQDQSGLFEPEYWFPGKGTGSYEAQQLKYPLHVGQTWIVDPQFRNVAEVVGREVVQTPLGQAPAWKIRMRNGGRLPGEEIFYWYGDLGYLGLKRHFQYVHGGPNPTTVTEDESEWLVSVNFGRQAPTE
jgi:hypothetical protein